MVYVLSKNNEPMMPCTDARSRQLLRQNKAKVVMREPFVIKLNHETHVCTQPLTHKVDSGSSKIGSAVCERNNVVYMAQIEIRNDITEKMTRRAKYRRMRRNRKIRYRKCRFLNRKNSIRKNRFCPTMKSKFDSHEKEIRFVRKILPITETIIETATFDAHALKNPEVLINLSLYQKGINYGFANTRAYVLTRDNYKCQNPRCICEIKKQRLEVHHIIFKSDGGSDEETNLITLCTPCHNGVHNGSVILKLKGKRKGNLRHATQMNSIRVQLLRRFPEAQETFGFITKEHRQLLGLPKGHYFDAVAIGSHGLPVKFKTDIVLLKKCVSDGDYQLSKGICSEQKIPVGKIFGFRKFDKVRYDSKHYFIKGRMATGYAILMGIDGEKIDLKPIPKFTKMKRVSARKSWMINKIKIRKHKFILETI